jgi:acyl-CoA synthetase (AMP-forming)/AMP-acid ligase II
MLITPDIWQRTDFVERVSRLVDTPALEQIVTIGSRTVAGGHLWEELLAKPAPRAPRVEVPADAACLTLFTSGTSGDPKGVLHTHNSLLAEVRTGPAATCTKEPNPRALVCFPAGHIAGVLATLCPILLGYDAVFLETWDSAHALELVTEHSVTRTAGTPFHLIGFLDAADAAAVGTEPMWYWNTGGAGVPPSVVERANDYGVHAARSYGSSEHPTSTGGNADDSLRQRAYTDGRALPGSEIRIVDDDGNEVPVGSEGEVVTIGPDQMLGYTSPELDAESYFPGGWFRSGDIGVLDHDGYLTITDRKKDIIIRAGENISSKQVEDYVMTHPAVREAAVVAERDHRTGERVCAFVTLEPSATLTIGDLLAHFESVGVAKQKTPERLEIIDELPRTASGKVKKFELRERLEKVSET